MGFFGRRPCPEPPHPRREPRLEGELTAENLARVFENCVDYNRRSVAVGGNEALRCEIIFLAGMVRMERVSDYVLRPLAQDRELGGLREAIAWEKMRSGALYSLSVTERTTLDEAAMDLIDGNCLLLFPGTGPLLQHRHRGKAGSKRPGE